MEDYLDIALGIEPPLSTSTIHPGTRESLFSRYNKVEGQESNSNFGVLLSGGRAQGGHHEDAWSVALNRNERSMPEEMETLENVEKAISKVNTYETDTGYNEIVVQHPEIAGVFFHWLEEDGNKGVLKEGEENILPDGNGIQYGWWWKTVGNFQKRDMPLFVLNQTNNTVREVYDLDFEKRTFKVGPVVEPAELTHLHESQKRHQTPEARKRAVGRVFDHVSGILTDEEKEMYRPESMPESEGWGDNNDVPPPLPKEEWDPNGSVPPPLT